MNDYLAFRRMRGDISPSILRFFRYSLIHLEFFEILGQFYVEVFRHFRNIIVIQWMFSTYFFIEKWLHHKTRYRRCVSSCPKRVHPFSPLEGRSSFRSYDRVHGVDRSRILESPLRHYRYLCSKRVPRNEFELYSRERVPGADAAHAARCTKLNARRFAATLHGDAS